MGDHINEEAIAILNKLIGYELIQENLRDILRTKYNIFVDSIDVSEAGGDIKIANGIENFGHELSHVTPTIIGFGHNKYFVFQTAKYGEDQLQ